jgi:ATP-dependent DNA ligase
MHSTDFEPQPTAKRIVQKLLKTSSYKGIVKKFKLTKEDEQYFAKLLLLTIMDPEFTIYAKQYILKTLSNFFGITKIRRKITPYNLSSPDFR